jgi:hypothetical protein
MGYVAQKDRPWVFQAHDTGGRYARTVSPKVNPGASFGPVGATGGWLVAAAAARIDAAHIEAAARELPGNA